MSRVPKGHPGLESLAAQRHEFLAFARHRASRGQESEDLVHDAYVKAMQNVGSLRSADRGTAWFLAILRNVIVDEQRRKNTRDRAVPLLRYHLAVCHELGEDRSGDTPICLDDLLSELHPRHRATLLMLRELGSVSELAQRCGVSERTAAVRAFRARRALRTLVARYE